jgi:hypothetical protein
LGSPFHPRTESGADHIWTEFIQQFRPAALTLSLFAFHLLPQ